VWRTASALAATFAVSHTDAEWRTLLTPDQFEVLRHAATERPFSSPLLHEERRGTFACARMCP
jgi:peptide-methionine (R)-S-oxide reductase